MRAATMIVSILLLVTGCSATESSDGFTTPEAHRIDVIERVRRDTSADGVDLVEAFNAVCRGTFSGSDDGFGQALLDGSIESSLPAVVFLDLAARLVEEMESYPRACDAGLIALDASTDQASTSPAPPPVASTADTSGNEASFLAVTKAGLREIPDLPSVTDVELIGLGYEMCNEIRSAIALDNDPKTAGASAALEAIRPDGLVDGGKGAVLEVRLVLRRIATEFLCADPSYRAWSEAFEDGVMAVLLAASDA